jgi:hypothetical protein
MTRKCICTGFVFLFLATALHAAEPVASVTSTEPFLLRGALVTVSGVPSWPVAAGDEIATGTVPAVITFRDGSRVTLNVKSKAKIESEKGRLLLRVLEGAGSYFLVSGSMLRLFSGTSPVPAGTGQGTIAVAGSGSGSSSPQGSLSRAARRPSPPAPVSQSR